MNCEHLQPLIEEVPPSRWSTEQRRLIEEHCRACESCQRLLTEQERMFTQISQMSDSTPSKSFRINIEDRIGATDARAEGRIWRSIPILLLCAGCILQMVTTNAIFPNWFEDGSRLESSIMLFVTAPVLSLVVVFFALVYAFTCDERDCLA